ncbi:MAG: J domain-containing protein [Lachnospiraceae bacterium]|nr:J domain-containing protein [Candidatus Colinaster scatohippi]
MDVDMTINSCKEGAENEPTYEQLVALKRWLFQEYNKIQVEKGEQQRIYDKFIKERSDFMEDMKRLNAKVLQEQKRLKEDNMFFDKKLQILQNGFMQLDVDRKKLERERREFELSKRKRSEKMASRENVQNSSFTINDVGLFFAGVNNPLALRKRYRDLLKIFHPDNSCGDEGIVKAINEEYERLKKELTY